MTIDDDEMTSGAADSDGAATDTTSLIAFLLFNGTAPTRDHHG